MIPTFRTPIGFARAVLRGGAVVALDFLDDGEETPERALCSEARLLREQLRAYFAGELRSFTVPVVLSGTPFQREVLTQIAHIPYGSTLSYLELAKRAGFPGAARAVGSAAARNPVLLLIPCHRIVRSDGGVSGYAGGKFRKEFLLALEQGSILTAAVPTGGTR